MVTNELDEGDLEIPGGGEGERLSGYVEWYENMKKDQVCEEQCGI